MTVTASAKARALLGFLNMHRTFDRAMPAHPPLAMRLF
jgi:hypothetical protein